MAPGNTHAAWPRLALVLVVLALLAVGVWNLARGGTPLTDEEQVRATIEEARRGVVAHRADRVLDVVSQAYDDGEYTRETLRALILTGLREYPRIEAAVWVREMQVTGERAVATLEVRAEGTDRSGSTARFEGTLRVRLGKEPARRYGVFPDSRWRVVAVEGLHHGGYALE
ncbi:MAG: hypothetical protein QHJ73_19040 [Armatimonadota bacterium]|nr:hypothetical protein [Armatimonadota bacterium]